jgi:maltose/moltooligosaccharide transporter
MTQHLGRRTIAYSFGQVAAGLYGAFNIFTLPLYLSHFTSNAILIGWLSSTRSFEQSIIQPLVGAASDRTQTRLGRRAPFYLTTMPIVALLFIVNAWIPRSPEFLWLAVVTIFVFSLLYNVGIDPYFALLVDAFPAAQRGTVNGIALVFGFAANIVVLVVAALLWDAHPDWVFYFVAAGILIGFGVVALGVREGRLTIRFQRPPTGAARETGGRLSLRRRATAMAHYLRQLFRVRREAMKLLGAKFLYEFGINAALPFLTLFTVQEIGLKGWPDVVAAFPLLAALGMDRISADGLSQLVAAFLLLMTTLAALPSGLLGDRFGKKKVFAAGLLILGLFSLLAATATTVPQLLIYLFVVGIGNGARIVLYQPFLADLITPSRAGEFMGLSAFAETGGVFLAIIVAGVLINLNLFGLHYRTVFVLTGLFVLLGFVALRFVNARPETTEPGAEELVLVAPAVPS